MRPFLEIFRYQSVLWQLVRQHLTLRYRRTVLGYFWTLLNPLLMMGVTAFVFSNLFKMDLKSYVLFLFAGNLPWIYFTNTVLSCSTTMTSNEAIIKKIYLPKILFPAGASIGLLIDSILSMFTLFALALAIGAKLSWALLILPFSFMLLYLFSTGVGLIVCVMTVFFRDMQHLLGVIFQAWFFLTPIMYKSEALIGKAGWLMMLNPFVPFVEIFRQPIFNGMLPPLLTMAKAMVIALLAFLGGYVVFVRNEKELVFHL